MSTKPSPDEGSGHRESGWRGHPRARLNALLAAPCKPLPDEYMKPGWPRWDAAMLMVTGILADVQAEIQNYERPRSQSNGARQTQRHSTADPATGDPCEHWQEAFKKWVEATLAVADDPFFDL